MCLVEKCAVLLLPFKKMKYLIMEIGILKSSSWPSAFKAHILKTNLYSRLDSYTCWACSIEFWFQHCTPISWNDFWHFWIFLNKSTTSEIISDSIKFWFLWWNVIRIENANCHNSFLSFVLRSIYQLPPLGLFFCVVGQHVSQIEIHFSKL